MTSNASLAFGDLIDRSLADGDPNFDRISLRNHIVEVEIGAFQAERDVTQRIAFDVVVEVAPASAQHDDDVDCILSYDRVTWAISHELAAERLNLLETLSERIAERILQEPLAQRVFVRIQKLDKGNGELGVEIMREKSSEGTASEDETAPRPNLGFLSNAAIASDTLASWLDQLVALGDPLVLCVGIGPVAPVQCGRDAAQRNIDLLAIEQNAWSLAARDTRCAVVATNTELDWAMKTGQICVWAPSKIVLDAVDGPHNITGPELTQWIAQRLSVKGVWDIGESLPKFAEIPVHSVALGAEII